MRAKQVFKCFITYLLPHGSCEVGSGVLPPPQLRKLRLRVKGGHGAGTRRGWASQEQQSVLDGTRSRSGAVEGSAHVKLLEFLEWEYTRDMVIS